MRGAKKMGGYLARRVLGALAVAAAFGILGYLDVLS